MVLSLLLPVAQISAHDAGALPLSVLWGARNASSVALESVDALSYYAWGGRKPIRFLTVPRIGAARCLAASAPARSTSSNAVGSSMKAL
jgi:hypothetical protein